MKKINFIESLVARLKGDDATVKASKIQRKAKSQIKIAISNVENEILKAEDSIESIEDSIKDAILNNGSVDFSDNMDYVNNILDKVNEKQDAIDNLESLKKELSYLKELYTEVSGE